MSLYLERDVVVEFDKYNYFSAESHKPNGIECTVLRKPAPKISKPQIRLKSPGWTAIQARIKIGLLCFSGERTVNLNLNLEI